MKQNIPGGSLHPKAWIAVSNNRQKIYGNDEVYLDPDQEFQIELYNPTSTKYLAKIYLNGKLTSTAGLVLMPGQRYFLDRFIDEDRKLIFSTYNVDAGDPEVMNAILENGLIKVEFFAEETQTYTWKANYADPLNWKFNSTGYVNGGFVNTTNTATWSTSWGGTSTQTIAGPAFTTTGISGTNTSFLTSNSNLQSAKIETGRVEKGGRSDQSFGSDFGRYSWWASFTTMYKLLPRSVKPVEVSEIRSYCPGCRTRVKKKTWKFCPNCGESLD